MPSYEPVTALLRGLKVLEAIAETGSATIKSLHAATGIPKATLVRMLETLIHAGYVYSAGDQPRYALTARALSIAAGFDQGQHLLSVVGPMLSEFQKSLGWPSDLGVFDRDAMVIVGTSRQPGVLSVNRKVGSRVPAVRTALGRACLAFLPDEQRLAALHDLKALTREPKDIKRFEAELAAVRSRGYAMSNQENLPSIRALAAPIFDMSGVVASLNIIIVAEAMSIGELQEKYAETLLSITEKMSATLRKTPFQK
jgi:IclR family mhp operon transcriptional activator